MVETNNIQIWGKGKSTVGTGAEAKPAAQNIPINVGGVVVSPVGNAPIFEFCLKRLD